jgi:prephenate dehydratase
LSKQTGYLGPGTFGEQAALLYDKHAQLVALPSNAAIVRAVSDASVEEGVVPIENTLEGPVNDTLDALMQCDGVFIRAEVIVPVEQDLIAAPGTKLEDITVVMSHPQALAQCRIYLEKALPTARLEAALSTAAAVEAAVGTPGAAAIGTPRAAELAGGEVLAPAIQDVAFNKTRFVVVGSNDAARTGDDKTSIAFTVAHDRPGTLIGVLKELSDRSLNMTRVESRPSRQDLGIYIFLIDFQGHRQDPVAAEALKAVEGHAHYFRLLGSYPRFVEATK